MGTTYVHFVDTNKMYAAQEQFRHITKMVCARFRDLTKTYHFGNVTVMVRNAGQRPADGGRHRRGGSSGAGVLRCAGC